MHQGKKQQPNLQFKRSPPAKLNHNKQLKSRVHHHHAKETFLTDTQTSDYTKSSAQSVNHNIIVLQKTIKKLQKQNSDLKQKILQLKKCHFYDLNEQKLQSIFKQMDALKLQLEQSKKDLLQISIQKDFLQRNNRILKQQCQNLTIQLLHLKNQHSERYKVYDQSSVSSKDKEESYKYGGGTPSSSRNGKMNQFLQWKRQKEQSSTSKRNKLKKSVSANRLSEDYAYGLTNNRYNKRH